MDLKNRMLSEGIIIEYDTILKFSKRQNYTIHGLWIHIHGMKLFLLKLRNDNVQDRDYSEGGRGIDQRGTEIALMLLVILSY